MLLYHYYLLIHKVLPTPPIQFPKGSYCSRFSGNIVGQKFTTYLKANQTLMVTPDLSLFDIVVRNPKGKYCIVIIMIIQANTPLHQCVVKVIANLLISIFMITKFYRLLK